MDENQRDEKMRQSFRRAAPAVDADSFCRRALDGEADGARPRRLLPAARSRTNLGWKTAVVAMGVVIVAMAAVVAVASSRATADESPLATMDFHSTTELQLGYLPAGGGWSQTYGTILSPPLSDTELAAAIKRGEKPGVRVEQCLYQSGRYFVQVRTVTDTGEPLPPGTATQVNGERGVLETGLSGLLGVAPPDLAVEFLGAKPGAGKQMTTTTAGPSGSGNTEPEASNIATTPQSSKEQIPYDDATRLIWTFGGSRVEMLSNLPVEELMKVAQGLVLGTTE